MPTARPAAITRKQVAAFLKPRPQDSHKGLFGTVTVVGGASGMVGAAILAGRAAFKMGAGSVHIGLLADKMPLVDMRMPELMLHPAAEALRTTRPDVLLVGCGLGQSLPAQKLLYDALQMDVALVLDADALNIIAQRPDLRGMLHGRKAPAVFTPHPGEAARLLGCSIEDIRNDRPRAALSLVQRLGGSVVLKGAGSLCATRDGKLQINQTGNPGMSSAGMGDVLAGMIAAFIAQGLSTDEALLLGVHLHGTAGDELDKQQAMLGMSATEVTEWARWLLNRMAPR
ncbi:bifunctional NAD(P)H-hydrate repair enzyme Nnr [mine drainage metagenome]|uniref:Bifunctional NAD(P)H-hydrate repair enzyme Nnr n=1 Tax=mine drainage metagenome TaxID=410659 RepID=A0A1J5SZP0_9ZZZZ